MFRPNRTLALAALLAASGVAQASCARDWSFVRTEAGTLPTDGGPTPVEDGGRCTPRENLGTRTGMRVATGTTVGAPNTAVGVGACEGLGETSPEVAFTWTAPATGTYAIDTVGSMFDTVLYVRRGTCGGPDLACNDDLGSDVGPSGVTVAVTMGDVLVIVIDGYSDGDPMSPGDRGAFVLNITRR